MVKKILFYITRQISGLHQAAYLLAAFTLISQILGLFRDRLLAHQFGASVTLDVYYAAFRIPDLVLVLAASIVSLAVLIPSLTERLEESFEAGRRFIDNVFTAFFLSIIGMSVVLYFLVPDLIRLLFPGFTSNPTSFSDIVMMTRILLCSPILLGLSNLFASITQVYRRFFIYALSPVLYNVGIIFGIVVLYPVFGIAGLAYGVVIGAVLHAGIQLPVLVSKHFVPRFRTQLDWKNIRSVVAVSLPRAFTLSMYHITIIALIGIASILKEGSITVFNLSFNLQSVPLALIGASYSLAAFPALSKLFNEKRNSEFVEYIATAARHIIFWSLPAVVLFIMLRAQIVRTVLGTGEFGWDATRLTAAALAIFVVSVVAQSIILLLVRGYYSAGRTAKPLYIHLVGMAITVVGAFGLLALFKESSMFRYFIESLFRVEGIEGSAVLMLPLAFSLGTIVTAVLLWRYFESDFGTLKREVRTTFFQSFGAAVIGGYTTYASLVFFGGVLDLTTLPGIFLQGLISGIIGVTGTVGVLLLLGNIELKEMITSVREHLWKVEVIPPEVEEL